MVDAFLWWADWCFKVSFYFFCIVVVVDDACQKFGKQS